MRYLVFIGIALILTSGFLTIEWFTWWAWISLAVIFGISYECFYVSQENNVKITRSILEKMEQLERQCTRMSTLLGDILDTEHPKKRFDSSKFKKN